MAELDEVKNPFLAALGDRVRGLRARRGLTRKAVAQAANVSERHLASLEYGEGNASILVLLQVAGALQCSLAELLGDVVNLPGLTAFGRQGRLQNQREAEAAFPSELRTPFLESQGVGDVARATTEAVGWTLVQGEAHAARIKGK